MPLVPWRWYAGAGGGGAVAPAQMLSTDGSWSGAQLTHRGDWTEDGYEDLVARHADGTVWLYSNDGLGQVSAVTRKSVSVFEDPEAGVPTDISKARQIVSLGDLSPGTDGSTPDFMAVIGDQLWFLPGYTGGTLESGYPIGDSGWANKTLVAPGDMDGDGLTDLLARDTSNGQVWLYRAKALDMDLESEPGTDPASLGDAANRVQFATGWTVAARPLITAPGDVNGDGVPDLWSTTASATAGLEFLPGRGRGVGAAVVVGTGGWQAVRAIA
ncbi:FG-GAP repeat domain-containing protein [Streptomyces sp. NPDC087850]|uniref:FG-GAP repeat domain-containing protein n=1 Tax=Streptomyces sp. NPDC087850 TaxID=3365809 RepID=UPI00381E8D36